MAALTPPARPCCVMSRPGPAAPAGKLGESPGSEVGRERPGPRRARRGRSPPRIPATRGLFSSRGSPQPEARRDLRPSRAGEDGDVRLVPLSSSQRCEILGPCVGVGRDKPWGCGQGMFPQSQRWDAEGIVLPVKQLRKYHQPQRGQEVELEFKNQPGQLKRVLKVRTGSKHWKLEGFIEKCMEICRALAITRKRNVWWWTPKLTWTLL